MPTIEIDTAVFNAAYRPYVKATQRTQIFYGGSASGKSVFLAQRPILDLLEGGRNYLIARQVARTIRGSVSQEIRKVINAWGVGHLFDVNKSDGTITCKNGYQILFVGLDDVEKLKSITPAKGAITDIWVEESTETDRAAVRQLVKRQRGGDESTAKRLVLSFNPILQSHWIYQDYFASIGWADDQREHITDDLLILKTTHKDNAFLTDADRADLENETDPYFHNVYTLGNWGVLGDVIFSNWEVVSLTDMRDQFVNKRNGLDFGFAKDPAGLIVSHYDKPRKTIYIFGEMYETGLTNDVLAERVENQIGREPVRCDSAEPKSIAELRRHGITALPARKGKDSVTHGIQWLQQQKIIIDPSCINFRNEISAYQWKKDAGGNSLPVPVDKNNHLLDALRYAYEEDSLEAIATIVQSPWD
jgi:phage terminase large subunit